MWCSGAISGALAAFITNPLDVAKTRIQTQCTSRLSLVTSPPTNKDVGFKRKAPTAKVGQIDRPCMRVVRVHVLHVFDAGIWELTV